MLTQLGCVVGAILTYYFTPEYGQQELEDVECLFPLEHACHLPTSEQLGALMEVKKSKSAPYTMVELIDTADNYGIGDYFDEDDDDPDLGIELGGSGDVSVGDLSSVFEVPAVTVDSDNTSGV